MALLSKSGTLSILSTDTVGTTKVASSFGFAPKAVFFFGSGHASGSDAIEAGHYKAGFGFAASASARRAVSGYSGHNVATTETRGGYSDAACFIQTANASIDGALDIQTFDSDGFTAVIDDQFVADVRVHWLAIGGPDLIDVAVGSFQTPTASGTFDITDVGFEPDCMIFVKAARNTQAPPNAAADCAWGIGAYDGASQWSAQVSSNAAVVLGVTQTMRYFKTGECIGGFNAAATNIEQRAQATAFLTNGVRLNYLEVGGTAMWNFYIAVRGGGYKVGSVQTRTDTTTSISITGSGFEPSAALFASAGIAESVADTPSDHNLLSIGMASGSGSQGAVLMRDTDAQGTNTACARAIDYSDVYLSESGAAIDGAMRLSSFDADGATLIMSDADPSARAVGYILLGPGVTPLNPHEGCKPWSSIWRPGRY